MAERIIERPNRTTPSVKPPRAGRAAPPLAPFWVEPTAAAFAAAQDLLDATLDLDLAEEDNRCTDARRLIDLACEAMSEHRSPRVEQQTEGDEHLLAEAAFDASAMLTAALNYPGQAFGSERRTAISSALNILDKLTDMLVAGRVEIGLAALPALLEAIALKDCPRASWSAHGTEFLAGRDLAVAMLAAGDKEAEGGDRCAAQRRYRGGAAQHRFTGEFLLQLVANPTLIEGFDAVLSAMLSERDRPIAEFFAEPLVEFQAGEVGADGTLPWEEDFVLEARSSKALS